MHQRSRPSSRLALAGVIDLSIGLTRCAVASHGEVADRLQRYCDAVSCLATGPEPSFRARRSGPRRKLALARAVSRDELVRSLIAAPHVLFVLPCYGPAPPQRQSSITRWRFWIKTTALLLPDATGLAAGFLLSVIYACRFITSTAIAPEALLRFSGCAGGSATQEATLSSIACALYHGPARLAGLRAIYWSGTHERSCKHGHGLLTSPRWKRSWCQSSAGSAWTLLYKQ